MFVDMTVTMDYGWVGLCCQFSFVWDSKIPVSVQILGTTLFNQNVAHKAYFYLFNRSPFLISFKIVSLTLILNESLARGDKPNNWRHEIFLCV